MHGALAAGRICTGWLLWLVNVSICGTLEAPTGSELKSNSRTEGTIALLPMPLTGTAKFISWSALRLLTNLSLAVRGVGHCAGAAPNGKVPEGNHGQPCCGENETVIVQLWCAASVKGDPEGLEQVSVSLKFGSPLKSLGPPNVPLTCNHSR